MLAANQNYNLSQCSLYKKKRFALVEVTGSSTSHCLQAHFSPPNMLLSLQMRKLAICGVKMHSLHPNTVLKTTNLLWKQWCFEMQCVNMRVTLPGHAVVTSPHRSFFQKVFIHWFAPHPLAV